MLSPRTPSDRAVEFLIRFLQLLANETVSGITAAFDTFVTATSIAYGPMVSAVIFPGRLGARGP